MPKSVAVVDVVERATQDVFAKACESFDADLAAYRAGVQAMAESGGTLPADKADELLAICQRLGIDASRLASDSTVFIGLRNINARIEAVQARNAARLEPLPQLEQAMQEASDVFVRVKVECDQKMKAAEAKLNEARRQYEKIANQREERTDAERAEVLELQNRNAHLFYSMTADELRRYLARR
jgi:hypothetical protein